MKNQKEAVYVATMNILAEAEIPFDDGMNVSNIITKDQRTKVIAILATDFLAGEIEMTNDARAKYNSLDKMKGYVNGLVSNWFRKDTRLNGGGKYVAKNPGSRAGVGDAQLKALKTLRTIKAGDAEALKAIDEHIARRTKEIGEEKAKTVTVDLSKIPPELAAQLGLIATEIPVTTDEETTEE